MADEQEFSKQLTIAEIELEVAKVPDFFKRIPDDLKAGAAINLILEIVNCGSRDYFQAIGIFDEAKNGFRDMALSVGAMDVEQDLLSKAFDNVQHFRCTHELEVVGLDFVITPGEICTIGYVGEDARYAGGSRFEVFREDGMHFSLCKQSLDDYFEKVDDIN